MTLADVNVLLAAFRQGHVHHARCRAWLETERQATAYGVSPQALSSVVRIVTNARATPNPSAAEDVLDYANALLEAPNAVIVLPGPTHWSVFAGLVRATGATGNLVPDAWFAALAIESGCTWVTMDQGFKRFPGLSVRTP